MNYGIPNEMNFRIGLELVIWDGNFSKTILNVYIQREGGNRQNVLIPLDA